MAEFLFEIGLEEVPARMLASAEAELQRRVMDLLTRERLLEDHAHGESFSTPRRLAVLVQGVLHRQADTCEEMVGPSLKVAFKDGVATAAAEAFAKKAGVATTELTTVVNPKGEYVGALVKRPGRDAAEVLAAEMPKEIAGIYWAKTMYWRAGKPERFVRPLRWLLAILDGAIVPIEWAGFEAGNFTYGHRILHGDAAITIDHPMLYRQHLEAARVRPHVEDRRYIIRKALDHVTREVEGARWREDHALVDAVTHLTEWPSVILGSFEAEYLTLPEEVLVTVMRDHQKYFAIEDGDGKLLPHFLAVLNTEADKAGDAAIRHGNERVLRARFNDARFFWDFDQKVPMTERRLLLDKVTFQKDLGSYAEKSMRVQAIALSLGGCTVERKVAVHLHALDQAAMLAKADLTAELVKEFTELQGIVGGLYARAQGHGEVVATAIYEQYAPASMEAKVPSTIEGVLLSISDKIDTISGMFGLGLQPTGSKDPFALRRAANGIVKMQAETQLPLTLTEIAKAATGDVELLAKLRAFFIERVEFYLRDVRGIAYDVVKAVMAAGSDDVRDAVARAQAITASRGAEDFVAIAAAFKRMKNILEQARSKGEDIPLTGREEFLVEPAERVLSEEAGRLASWVEGLRREKEYTHALQAIATLRPHVDDFFNAVMVMADDKKLRTARLGLLQRVLADFSKIADFSEIVIAG